MQPSTVKNEKAQREFKGEVVGEAAQKTIRVLVLTKKMHPKYRKQYVRHKTFAVHDEKETAHFGDRVRFVECRPISKTKRWRLIEVLSS